MQYDSNNSNKKFGFGDINIVYFDITPSINTKIGAIFFIKLQNKFTFASTCISVATESLNNIEALPEDKYTCMVD